MIWGSKLPWRSRGISRQFTEFAFEGFAALTVAGVARRIGHAVAFGTAQVLGHLGLQGTLHQSPGELLEQAVFTNEVFLRFVISQQAVYEFVAYGHYSSFSKYGSFLPNNRLHKNSYTLASCCTGSTFRLRAPVRNSLLVLHATYEVGELMLLFPVDNRAPSP
jgi:hypothetical protein